MSQACTIKKVKRVFYDKAGNPVVRTRWIIFERKRTLFGIRYQALCTYIPVTWLQSFKNVYEFTNRKKAIYFARQLNYTIEMEQDDDK